MEHINKKLVAIFTNHDDDIYCFRKELIEGLLKAEYNVLISCPYGEKFELMKEINYIYEDVYIDRRGTNLLADGKLFFHYLGVLKKYKPSVVLTYTAKPNVYVSIAAKMLKIPYINNITGLGSVMNMGGIKQNLIMSLFKVAFSNADHIFFQNSENMKLAIDKGFVKGSYKLIPGSGVDTKRFPLQDYPEGGNGREGKTVVFNYIGRVLKDKGIDTYIEAAKIIKKKYPKTEFNVIGFIEPTEQHYLNDFVEFEKKGIVIYRGSQKDVRPYIERSHATIHPSIYGEGMSNVLLESASSGRVLITTNNVGCREIVNDGETGFIYSGGQVDELVKKIEMFLSLDNDQRRIMGAKGREKVDNEFNRDIVVEAYLREINRILN